MSRERILEEVLSTDSNLILELGTGMGKTKLAIEKLKQLQPNSILIVVPRLVLISNWKDELKLWGAEQYISKITFSTYVGLHSKVGNYEMCIYDEAHRLTDKNKEYIREVVGKYNMFLSATLSDIKLSFFKNVYRAYHIRYDLRDAIESEILPTPNIIEHSLELSKIPGVFYYPVGKNPTRRVSYAERWTYIRAKKDVLVVCTAQQYLDMLNDKIKFLKKVYTNSGSMAAKNTFLKANLDRLKFLASLKDSYVRSLIKFKLEGYRYLLFCSSIEQAEALCENTVTSKSKKASKVLEQFNAGKINTLAACNMLNEGISLKDCANYVFVSINASEVMQVQKIGRSMRHTSPNIHLVYFRGTREEELVNEIKQRIYGEV